MSHNSFKTKYFILLFIILFINTICAKKNFATNVTVLPTTTTTRKPVGHKVEGAQYYDEMWDKYSVIAIEGEGGSGEGGGSSGSGSGTKNSGGSATGVPDGTGTRGNSGGGGTKGSGSSGDSTGSGPGSNIGNSGSGGGVAGQNSYYSDQNSNAAANALRESIEASRVAAEAIALEQAKERDAVRNSIAERERVQNSIQERLRQESLKAKVFGNTTQVTASLNIQKETDIAKIEYTYKETTVITKPTSVVVEEETTRITHTTRSFDPSNMVETTTTRRQPETYVNIVPTANSNEMPITTTAAQKESQTPPPTMTRRENVAGSIYETTIPKETTTIAPEETSLFVPQTFSTPLEQNNIQKQENPITETEKETEKQKETSNEKKEGNNDTEETLNDGGVEGDDNNKDKNTGEGNSDDSQKLGDQNNPNRDSNDTMNGDGVGIGLNDQITGDHKGFKVFEIKKDGNFGFKNETTGNKNLIKTILFFAFMFLMSLGIILYFLDFRKNKKIRHSYF